MDRPPFGRRALLALLVIPLATLVAGVVTMGAGGARLQGGAAGGPCEQHALRYGVTDDPAELNRQKAFEARLGAVTAPGFHTREQPPTATLHAVAHASVVILYGPRLGADAERGLRRLDATARRTKAPVVIAPREQDAALVVVADGAQLTCTDGDRAATAAVHRFAARQYATLADER